MVYLQPLTKRSLGYNYKAKSSLKILFIFLKKRLCSLKNSFRFAAANKARK